MGAGSASLGLALTVLPLTVKFSSRFWDDFSQQWQAHTRFACSIKATYTQTLVQPIRPK